MNITLSVDDGTVHKARRQAERLRKSVNHLVREYLERLAGASDPEADAAGFERGRSCTARRWLASGSSTPSKRHREIGSRGLIANLAAPNPAIQSTRMVPRTVIIEGP